MNNKYILLKFNDLKDKDELHIFVKKNKKAFLSFTAEQKTMPNKEDIISYLNSK